MSRGYESLNKELAKLGAKAIEFEPEEPPTTELEKIKRFAEQHGIELPTTEGADNGND